MKARRQLPPRTASRPIRSLVVCVLGLLLGLRHAEAQSTVMLEIEPDIQTIVIGSEIKEISLTARTESSKVRFLWSLEGPGTLEGEVTQPGIFYLPPSELTEKSARAIITVTVKQDDLPETAQRVSFILTTPSAAPPPPLPTSAPAPTALPTITPPLDVDAPIRLTIEADPNLQTIRLAQRDTPTKMVLMVSFDRADAAFAWELSGPGKLDGDITSSVVVYSLPDVIAQQFAPVKIAVTVRYDQGKTAYGSKKLNLLASARPIRPTRAEAAVGPAIRERRAHLAFQPVKAGEYPVSPYLRQYLNYLGQEVITLQAGFAIQSHEVTVGEFREYVNSLDAAGRARVGSRWEKGRDGKPYPAERPVEYVNWQEAANYAVWLSQQTQWDLRLPTVTQWAAACTQYYEKNPVTKIHNQPLAQIRSQVDHLLGNLREWSADACADDEYHLLGVNYMTDASDVKALGQAQCTADDKWNGIGFRLVRIEQPANNGE